MTEQQAQYGDEPRPMTLAEVYEKWSHIDHLLSDPIWLGADNPRGEIMHDLWLGVKGAMGTEDLLSQAIQLLADWCNAILDKGGGWDDWDEFYKIAAYRDGPLRRLIDAARNGQQ